MGAVIALTCDTCGLTAESDPRHNPQPVVFVCEGRKVQREVGWITAGDSPLFADNRLLANENEWGTVLECEPCMAARAHLATQILGEDKRRARQRNQAVETQWAGFPGKRAQDRRDRAAVVEDLGLEGKVAP